MSLLSSFFGEKQEAGGEVKTIIDGVTYVAGLVSNPEDTGQLLDAVRDITARLQPGEAPSAEDEQQLFSIYLQLEGYLITKEPLRHFIKEDLRKRIAEPLIKQLNDFEATQKRPQVKV
jgi:hypothetical protein